jgi:hypothetical protein
MKSGVRGAWLCTFSWRVHRNIGGEGYRRHCCCVQVRCVGCGVAQLVMRRLAVSQARVRFSAWHLKKVFSTELTSEEEMERNFGAWQRMNVLYECDGMNVWIIKYQNQQS